MQILWPKLLVKGVFWCHCAFLFGMHMRGCLVSVFSNTAEAPSMQFGMDWLPAFMAKVITHLQEQMVNPCQGLWPRGKSGKRSSSSMPYRSSYSPKCSRRALCHPLATSCLSASGAFCPLFPDQAGPRAWCICKMSLAAFLSRCVVLYIDWLVLHSQMLLFSPDGGW